MNQRLWIGVIVAAVVATIISFAAVRYCSRSATPNIHDAGDLKTELGLDAAQAERIVKLEAELRQALADCCKKHCAARFDLSQELAKPQTDRAAMQRCVDRMCAAQTESEQATLVVVLRVRELLTPAQREKYAQLLNQQLCTPATMKNR